MASLKTLLQVSALVAFVAVTIAVGFGLQYYSLLSPEHYIAVQRWSTYAGLATGVPLLVLAMFVSWRYRRR